MAEAKYFKSELGKHLTNGAVTVRFKSEVISTSSEPEIALLKKAESMDIGVKELTKEEAMEAAPSIFDQQEPTKGKSKKVKKEEGKEDDGATKKEEGKEVGSDDGAKQEGDKW